ncbi:CBS domain-containing protein [Candidatus Bathyarchaeota archaeon]|nr:CBS domain-containing protein [Candidatus Bathyarchaeota archaeon]
MAIKVNITVEDAMRNTVITVTPYFSAKQAAKLMDLRGVSSLVVIREGMLKGILTEKDLVTGIVARGYNPSKIRVENIMSQPVITIKVNSSLEDAVRIMLINGIKKLPVLNTENKLIGILSLTDVAMICPALYSTMKQLLDIQQETQSKAMQAYIT